MLGVRLYGFMFHFVKASAGHLKHSTCSLEPSAGAKIQQAIEPLEDLTADHRKETQIAVVWTCLPFIRSGQNYLARHSKKGKKIRQTEEEVGR